MADTQGFPPRKPAVAIAIKTKPFDAPGESGEVMFKAPEGFDTAGMQPGQTKEVVAEIEMSEGGMIKLKSINGMPLVGKPEDAAPGDGKDSFMSNAMPAESGEGEEA